MMKHHSPIRKLFIFLPALLLLLCGMSSVAEKEIVVPKIGDEICISGYIMDRYCIDLGVLLDQNSVQTLSSRGPVEHSVHCLIDISHCNSSPYEVINELDTGDYGRYWRLASNDLIIDYAHENAVCNDCMQTTKTEGFISRGLRLTLTATVIDVGSDDTPPRIEIQDSSDIHPYEDFESVCGNVLYKPPNGIIKTSGSLTRLVLVHGSFMLIGWGFLLPTGVIIAKFGKHRPNAWWFKLHRVIQPIGLLFALIGWSIALHNFRILETTPDGYSKKFPHAVLGMTTMVIGLGQPINAILRPHLPKEGKEKSLKRFAWEIFHKGLGWTGVILGLATVGIGTTLIIDNTHRLIFQVFYALSICIIAASALFLYCEKKKVKSPEEDSQKDEE